VAMPRCSIPVADDWIRLQWVLHMNRVSPISAMRGSDALFPNDFGEDLLFFSSENMLKLGFDAS